MPKMRVLTLGLIQQAGQIVSYAVGDDGTFQRGVPKSYTALSAGQYAGTSTIWTPNWAGATVTFTAATFKITNPGIAAGIFQAGDTIRVTGSSLNDGIYTCNGINLAGEILVNEALVDEAGAAGVFVIIDKRDVHTNNCVVDNNTGLLWNRLPSASVGPASNGRLNWYDAASVGIAHPAAADLQMIAASRTLRVVGGAGEIGRYQVGRVLVCAGFANTNNNVPGYVIESVTVNGADLDIVLTTFGIALVDEAAAGARTIGFPWSNIWAYARAANEVALAGYSDWRIPNAFELFLLHRIRAASGVPDPAYFPGWPAALVWCSSTRANSTNQALQVAESGRPDIAGALKTSVGQVPLIRGG